MTNGLVVMLWSRDKSHRFSRSHCWIRLAGGVGDVGRDLTPGWPAAKWDTKTWTMFVDTIWCHWSRCGTARCPTLCGTARRGP